MNFTAGGGGVLNLSGTGSSRAVWDIAYNNFANTSVAAYGMVNLAGTSNNGILNAKLSSLVVADKNFASSSSGGATGSLTLSNNSANHLDISSTVANPLLIAFLSGNTASGGTVSGNVNLASLDTSSQIVSTNGSAITIGSYNTTSGSTTVAGTLSLGGGSLNVQSSGANPSINLGLISGTNSGAGSNVSGTLNLNGGTLAINNAILGGSSTGSVTSNSVVNFNGGTLQATTAISSLLQNITAVNVSNAGAFIDTNGNTVGMAASLKASGSGGLTKVGAGELTVSGSSNYTGGTTVSGGTLQLAAVNALGSGGLTANAGVVDLNGIVLSAANSNALTSLAGVAGTITDSSGTATATVTGLTVIQSTSTTFGGSIQTGPNSRMVSLTNGGSGSLTLSGVNTLGSANIQNSATLQISGNMTAGAVNVSGSSHLAGNGTITLGGDGLIYNSSAASTFSGTLTGSGDGGVEVKAGMLTLGGSNGYTGGTTLDPGTETLVVSNAAGSATGLSPVLLNGGTLASGSAGSIGAAVLAGTNAHMIAPGGIGPIGSLAIGGSVSLNSYSTLDFDINGGSYDLLNITGVLAESGAFAINLNTTGTLAPSYTLATFASSPGLSFTSSGIPANYQLTATNNDLILSFVATGPATWAQESGGSWKTSSMWSGGTVPSGVGQQAVVGVATTGSWTITLDSPQTLGTLTFGNSTSNTGGYTLSAGSAGSLTLDNSGSAAAIVVTGGSHGIAADVAITLNSNLVISPTAGSTLEIDANISENPLGSGKMLLLNDAGTLILGGSNNFSGGATVSNGILILTNSEALADGTSLTVGDASAFAPGPVVPSLAASQPTAITAVPEPGTWLLLAVGAAFLLVTYRRKEELSS